MSTRDNPLPYAPDQPRRPNAANRLANWIQDHRFWNLVLFAISLGTFIYCVVWAPSHLSYVTQTTLVPGSNFNVRVREPTLSSPVWVVILAIVSAILALLLAMIFLDPIVNRRPNPNTRSQRVARLTNALNEAVGTIEGIRREVEEGNALLAQLQADTEVNRQLSDMSKEQSDAVWKAAADIIRAENRRQMPVNIVTQIVIGLVIAVAAGIIIGHFAL